MVGAILYQKVPVPFISFFSIFLGKFEFADSKITQIRTYTRSPTRVVQIQLSYCRFCFEYRPRESKFRKCRCNAKAKSQTKGQVKIIMLLFSARRTC